MNISNLNTLSMEKYGFMVVELEPSVKPADLRDSNLVAEVDLLPTEKLKTQLVGMGWAETPNIIINMIKSKTPQEQMPAITQEELPKIFHVWNNTYSDDKTLDLFLSIVKECNLEVGKPNPKPFRIYVIGSQTRMPQLFIKLS